MAEEAHYTSPKTTDQEYDGAATVETTDRGLFNFIGKKEEEKQPACEQEAMIASEFEEKVHVSEPVKEEKKESLLEKLHRSDSSSSSSSSDEEEVVEGGEKIKKKKKKGLKEKIKEKIHGGDEEKKHEEDTSVPIEKCEEEVAVTAVPPPTHLEPEEKKGFLEKIKEKLPGGQKKAEEEGVVAPAPHPAPVVAADCATVEVEAKEKKGILEKIKEKLPGYHAKTEEEIKKEKE